MKIKDIFYIVCELCGNTVLGVGVKNSEVKKDDADIKRMFDCYNLVVHELSEEVEPLIYRQTLSSENGKFYYSLFTKTPKQILKAFVNGKEVTFKIHLDFVEVNASNVEFLYDYVPQKAETLYDTAEYDGIFSARLLALGVASEYLLISGLYKEALMMREKFEKGITSYKQKKNRVIKARRWV